MIPGRIWGTPLMLGSRLRGLSESLHTRGPGQACLRRFETVERSGPGLNRGSQARKPGDVSLKAAFGDSSAVVGSRVDYCPILTFFRVFFVSR